MSDWKKLVDAHAVTHESFTRDVHYLLYENDVFVSFAYYISDDKCRVITVDGLKGVCGSAGISTPVYEAMEVPNEEECMWVVPVISRHGHKFWMAIYKDNTLVVCDTEMRADFLIVSSSKEFDRIELEAIMRRE